MPDKDGLHELLGSERVILLPLRTRRPETYYALPVVAACMNANSASALRCPLAYDADEDAQAAELGLLHGRLLRAARSPDHHSALLDQVLSELLPEALACKPAEYNGALVATPLAEQLLNRFYRVQQRISNLPLSLEAGQTLGEKLGGASWNDAYITPEGRSTLRQNGIPFQGKEILEFLNNAINLPWFFFYVTETMDTNSVIFLLQTAHLSAVTRDVMENMFRYVDFLAKLIDQHDSLSEMKKFALKGSPEYQALENAGFFDFEDAALERQACEITKIFLYSAWSRSVMLLFYAVIGKQLGTGSSGNWSDFLAVQGLKQLEDLTNLGQGAAYYRVLAPEYLCNWSLEVLRRSRSALCLDFRTLTCRYTQQFPNFQGRCRADSVVTCDVEDPSSCDRFKNATTKSQTAHTSSCDIVECTPVTWDKQSYFSVSGPRAVAVEPPTASTQPIQLRYVKASKQTLAISHVWAHGQGGRPEDGINSCLHQHYTKMAQRFDCGAYWIDSACIPTEGILRREAISYINLIFSESKVVLISDRDLEQIDLEDPIRDRTWTAEIIFSVLLVCDWNIRAWTLLEGLRGSQTTHVLCKNGQTVSLIETLRLVWQEGPIDLAILIGSIEHLLPSTQHRSRKSIEEGAQMLGYRHASHPRDEVFIWSLLNLRQGDGDPVAFWKATSSVNTAFLVSSARRLQDARGRKISGFSWAPASPIASPESRTVQVTTEKEQNYIVRYPAYDGNRSYVARIGNEGMHAIWSYVDFDHDVLAAFREDFCTVLNPNGDWDMDDDLEYPYSDIFENPDSALLAQEAETALEQGLRVRLLRPAADDGQSPYRATEGRGDVSGDVAVMVVSQNNGEAWSWHGVYQYLDNRYWIWSRAEMFMV